VLAPLAVNVALEPGHIVAEVAVTTGEELTVTVEVAVPVHPAVVPETVYTVVDAGLAVTLAPVVPLNPVPGLQL
jgi:hypothetical protein